MGRTAVTTDWTVVTALVKADKKQKKPRVRSAARVAELLGLGPFQITARLKAMTGRDPALIKPVMKDGKRLWAITKAGKALAKQDEPKEEDRPKRPRKSGQSASGAPPPKKPSDKGVPVITYMKRTEGWTDRRESLGHNEYFEVYISPDGVEFVQAHPFEKADMIRKYPNIPGLSPTRYVRFENSVQYRHLTKAAKKAAEEAENDKKRQKAKKSAKQKKKRSAEAIAETITKTKNRPKRDRVGKPESGRPSKSKRSKTSKSKNRSPREVNVHIS